VFLRGNDASLLSVQTFAERLAAWRPLTGHGISRGHGRCTVEDVRHGALHLDDPDDLLRWLSMSGPDLARTIATEPVHAPTDANTNDILLSVPVSITGPCRTGSGGEPVDQLIPIFRVGVAPALPGSGLKGFIRSRAECILRSVGITPEPCRDQTCGRCWTCQVFGCGSGQDMASTSVGVRSAIRVADATVQNPIVVRRTHIAIDRFTGGVLATALCTMEAGEAGTFTLQVEQLEMLPPFRVGEIRHPPACAGRSERRHYRSGRRCRPRIRVDVSRICEAERSGELSSAAEARRVLAGMVEEL
jgi:hypothetical protein